MVNESGVKVTTSKRLGSRPAGHDQQGSKVTTSRSRRSTRPAGRVVNALGMRAEGSGCSVRVESAGRVVDEAGVRDKGSGIRAQGSGCKVQGDALFRDEG